MTLAVLVNRTVIKATPEFLTIWNGPVPWYGNRKLAVGELARLYCHQEDKKKDEANPSYSVHALKKGGDSVELVAELARNQALFIVQKLGRWLRIEHPLLNAK
jgi:hypothetical protein